MDDKYEELDKIFSEKIDEVNKCSYDRLLEICEQENIEEDNLEEEELRKLLLEYFNEELEY